jgi:hypothetical protein
MHLFAEAVSCAVDELSTVPRPLDDSSTRPIDLITAEVASLLDG